MFEIISEQEYARTGILKTKHNKVRTPCFMPVATKASLKFVTTRDLKEMKTDAIISNAFILSLQPGAEAIKEHGGLHKFMSFGNTIFCDNGGFQMIREGIVLNVYSKGIMFKNPFTGKRVMCSPEYIVNIMQNLGCDVMMALDYMPLVNHTREQVIQSLKYTHNWQERSKKAKTTKQLMFGICQGGFFPDLRKKSAEFVNSLDFDGVAIGGLSIGEKQEQTINMVNVAAKVIDKNKPRYVMGVGGPDEIIKMVKFGVDVFDSCMATRHARHGTLFTSKGTIDLDNKEHKNSMEPIDKNCGCYVCKNYTKKYLSYLRKTALMTAHVYLSYHNLYYMQRLMENIREKIKEEKL